MVQQEICINFDWFFFLAWSIGHCGICSKDLNKFGQIFSQHPYIYRFRYVLSDSNKNNQLKPLFEWKRFKYPIIVLIQLQLQLRTNTKCFKWRIVLITCKWYSCINNWGENILVNIHVVGCYIVDLGKCVSCLKKADAKKNKRFINLKSTSKAWENRDLLLQSSNEYLCVKFISYLEFRIGTSISE